MISDDFFRNQGFIEERITFKSSFVHKIHNDTTLLKYQTVKNHRRPSQRYSSNSLHHASLQNFWIFTRRTRIQTLFSLRSSFWLLKSTKILKESWQNQETKSSSSSGHPI